MKKNIVLSQAKNTIACFISPHGFGHAARASAVIEAILAVKPDTHFHLFTSVPEWFFQNSLKSNWTYHPLRCDIGLVQKTALQEDIDATLRQLADFFPFPKADVQTLAEEVQALDCTLVLCDIAPLGLAVANQAGLPSVLVENFTWDWIYSGYSARHADFQPFIDLLHNAFRGAGKHIRTQPFCDATPADLVTAPVSRKPRAGRQETRERLKLSQEQKVVLITMGGVPDRLDVHALRMSYPDTIFIVPGGSAEEERVDHLLLLPHQHRYFHPDLVAASDAVLGKVGYSTIGEVYWAGIPFAYVSRQGFRESVPLVGYLRENIPGFELKQSEFESGDWTRRIGALLEYAPVERSGENGAGQIANFLASSMN